MKILASESKKFYNGRLNEEDWLDRLTVPSSSVKDTVLKNVDDSDIGVLQYLVDNKVIPTLVSNHSMRNNPYYDMEDKFIQLVKKNDGSRVYAIPYPGNGRFGEGNIYYSYLTVYDDENIQFENGKVLNPYDYSSSTLRKYFRL